MGLSDCRRTTGGLGDGRGACDAGSGPDFEGAFTFDGGRGGAGGMLEFGIAVNLGMKMAFKKSGLRLNMACYSLVLIKMARRREKVGDQI